MAENTGSQSRSGYSGSRSYSRPSGGQGGPRGQRRPMRRRRFPRRKVCRFCVEGVKYIDFKNYRMLRDFLTERGKIMPRRITGNCAHHQRMLTTAIKRARNIALLSFVHR